ncbi:4Fe-4S binding domain-containing protein [Aromatoleum tolulyticum]|uniref:4Fe-4S binding domain-containing protein n=1 Tax=Aromatoleum tolulyticum TaxID=34027 RepID=A0A1N6W2D0_9RHOO|nr:4Fe-4S dicluster domain-containing protein [Aromatoleum tolulyticum]SIQ84281.1 4Fe-4S binding domain-containing protein [Aromatoleum tolulyticum]
MERQLRLCDCNRSFAVDEKALAAGTVPLKVHHELCRREIGEFESALACGDVLVGCTQEAALFAEVAAERPTARIDFFNLRENAGWSAEGRGATPKMAALIAAAMLPEPEPVAGVTLAAGNQLLIVGEAGAALGWAERLTARFDVSVLLTGMSRDAELPTERRYPVWSGAGVTLTGHLGAFDAAWTQQNPIDLDLCVRCNACIRACPEGAIGWDYQVDAARCRSHRACVTACGTVGAIDFARTDTRREGRFDLVLDLSAEPLIKRVEPPQGYAAPGRDPLDQALAAQALGDLMGEFEKPRYVALDPKLCAHSRSRKTGCTACIESCAAEAIASAGDTVRVDPYLCQGCGTCSTVCPTGALASQYPRVEDLGLRVKTVLARYREAGGEAPALLFHSAEAGRALIDRLARRGKGLPARVIPFETWSADAVGLDLMLGSLALGACQVAVLAAGTHDATPLRAQAAHAQTILAGLGYGGAHVRVIDAGDWSELEAALWDWTPAQGVSRPATFRLVARKRDTLDFALRHLHALAPVPVAEIPLQAGAPFGAVAVSDACTLCMSCVGVCPTGALSAATDAMRLGFLEKSCVQCGLCASSCPENAIALTPRLLLDDAARRVVPLKEAEIFHCVRCGAAMGAKPIIDTMLARLAGHSMFASEAQRRRLQMCADCRVIDLMENENGTKAWDMTE